MGKLITEKSLFSSLTENPPETPRRREGLNYIYLKLQRTKALENVLLPILPPENVATSPSYSSSSSRREKTHSLPSLRSSTSCTNKPRSDPPGRGSGRRYPCWHTPRTGDEPPTRRGSRPRQSRRGKCGPSNRRSLRRLLHSYLI